MIHFPDRMTVESLLKQPPEFISSWRVVVIDIGQLSGRVKGGNNVGGLLKIVYDIVDDLRNLGINDHGADPATGNHRERGLGDDNPIGDPKCLDFTRNTLSPWRGIFWRGRMGTSGEEQSNAEGDDG